VVNQQCSIVAQNFYRKQSKRPAKARRRQPWAPLLLDFDLLPFLEAVGKKNWKKKKKLHLSRELEEKEGGQGGRGREYVLPASSIGTDDDAVPWGWQCHGYYRYFLASLFPRSIIIPKYVNTSINIYLQQNKNTCSIIYILVPFVLAASS
jgi:hypothetical protein